jgi:hypothetical protein
MLRLVARSLAFAPAPLHFEMCNPQINHWFEASFLFLSFFKTGKLEITLPYWIIASSGRKRMLIRAIQTMANALVHGHAPVEPDEVKMRIVVTAVWRRAQVQEDAPLQLLQQISTMYAWRGDNGSESLHDLRPHFENHKIQLADAASRK